MCRFSIHGDVDEWFFDELVQVNYLAHAYLSFGHPEVLTGNMISDFVKGRKRFNFSPGIQAGISLHRAIDAYTDAHPATREACLIFRPHYRLYAAAFTDVVFDHFLAADTSHFPEDHLPAFAATTYQQLQPFQSLFPEKFAAMFPYMQQQNWLLHYGERWGIERSFGGLVRRSSYLTESAIAFQLFEQHYEWLRQCYNSLFPDVYQYASTMFQSITQALPGTDVSDAMQNA